jgi:ribosomal protein L28
LHEKEKKPWKLNLQKHVWMQNSGTSLTFSAITDRSGEDERPEHQGITLSLTQ